MRMMDLRDDCKISHLGGHCLGQILCKVELPKATEFDGTRVRKLGPKGGYVAFSHICLCGFDLTTSAT